VVDRPSSAIVTSPFRPSSERYPAHLATSLRESGEPPYQRAWGRAPAPGYPLTLPEVPVAYSGRRSLPAALGPGRSISLRADGLRECGRLLGAALAPTYLIQCTPLPAGRAWGQRGRGRSHPTGPMIPRPEPLRTRSPSWQRRGRHRPGLSTDGVGAAAPCQPWLGSRALLVTLASCKRPRVASRDRRVAPTTIKPPPTTLRRATEVFGSVQRGSAGRTGTEHRGANPSPPILPTVTPLDHQTWRR
jgi:hypothetical protein